MAFASDSFTDVDGTTLASHTPDLGGPWVKHTTTQAMTINGNRARAGGSGENMAYLTATPATAEYDVEGDLVPLSHIGGSSWGIAGRMNTAQRTCYFVQYFEGDRKFYLSRMSNGTVTNIISVAQALTLNQSYRVKLQIRDAAKKVFVDGAEILSSADNTITAAGLAGLRFFGVAGATTGYHLDNLAANDVAAATFLSRTIAY